MHSPKDTFHNNGFSREDGHESKSTCQNAKVLQNVEKLIFWKYIGNV